MKTIETLLVREIPNEAIKFLALNSAGILSCSLIPVSSSHNKLIVEVDPEKFVEENDVNFEGAVLKLGISIGALAMKYVYKNLLGSIERE